VRYHFSTRADVCRKVPSYPWVSCGGPHRGAGLVGFLWGGDPRENRQLRKTAGWVRRGEHCPRGPRPPRPARLRRSASSRPPLYRPTPKVTTCRSPSSRKHAAESGATKTRAALVGRCAQIVRFWLCLSYSGRGCGAGRASLAIGFPVLSLSGSVLVPSWNGYTSTGPQGRMLVSDHLRNPRVVQVDDAVVVGLRIGERPLTRSRLRTEQPRAARPGDRVDE
jgi:hypothetical protein